MMPAIARSAPGFIAVEPDQAREHCVNMIRKGVQFCCEINPGLSGMKDVVVLSRSAVLEQTAGWTSVRTRCTNVEEACHYVLRLIHEELTFQANPETRPNDPTALEYLFLVELRADGRRAESRR
jgi:hypothetical protein